MSRFFLLVMGLVLAGCQAPLVNQAPSGLLAGGEPSAGCFACERCGSLEGNGPQGKLKKPLRTAAGENCVHEWYGISRQEFRELAAERFGIDWSLEDPRWSGGEEMAPGGQPLPAQ